MIKAQNLLFSTDVADVADVDVYLFKFPLNSSFTLAVIDFVQFYCILPIQ